MASNFIYLSGKCKWAKVRKPDEKYQNYQVPLYLDTKSLETLKASGMQLTIKTDDDGKFVTLRRPVSKLIKGELVEFGPPKVFDKDNHEFHDGLIGNGSSLTCKVVVYDTIKGKGHRLESLRVENLVEYHRPEDDTPVAVAAKASQPALPF